MSDLKQFKMPDLGEGLTEADILRWTVKPGDTVVVNEIIVEVETVKAAVELPSPFAGVVTALHAAAGDTVDVGTPIITIDVGGDAEPAATAAPADTGSVTEDSSAPSYCPQVAAAANAAAGELGGRQPVLVGYGPRAGAAKRRARKAPTLSDAPSANPAFNIAPGPRRRTLPRPATACWRSRRSASWPRRSASTSARSRPTGPNGTVSREDVQSAAPQVGTSVAGGQLQVPTRGETAHLRGETRIPIKGVRKHTAAAMVASAFTAPHVTEFITVDVTPMMELRERIAARRDFRDVKVSPLVFVAKALILAAKRTPQINAFWDEPAGEIVLKHYVNLGIAAATDRGLIVPNIKNADQLSLLELARAIGELTETARAGKTSPADMAGGTITITNVGVFGVDTGTPILNPGEAGIVAFGAVRRMPWVVDDEIEPSWVTQLAVSFDHRMVDGQQGSQFLADMAGVLADPGLGLL